MLQMARNLTDTEGGALRSKKYLIIDRDTKYTQQFRRLILDEGTKVIRLPPRSPNLNAYASHCTSFERFGKTAGNRRLSESLVP
jgi:putative transposase